MNRDELKNKIWTNVPPSAKGYGDLIDQLMSYLTDEQLEEIGNKYADDDDE